MPLINEDSLEQIWLKYLQEIGYSTIYGPDILPQGPNPLRTDVRQPYLPQNLKAALERINPTATPQMLEDAYAQLTRFQEASLILKNQKFCQLLAEGVKVNHKDATGRDTATYLQVLDYTNPDNNEFLAINQFTIQGHTNTRRADIIIFINGLPMVVIELKNPSKETTDIRRAYNQIQTYKNDIEDLFIYNVANIIADGINARLGSLTANFERYMPWRTIHGEKESNTILEDETLVKGFLDGAQFLDFIKFFMLFEHDSTGKTIKKIAGYHQFHAVRKAFECAVAAVQNQTRKIGVVWHTTGAGKSISMVCFAKKVMTAKEMQNPTIVVVTDRNDLDTQLFGTFNASSKELSPDQAESREDLQALLKNKPSGGVIFTTMQKFAPPDGQDAFPMLSDRNNIIVISDEAHRTQYGFDAKFTKDGKIKYGLAKYLRDALPNAAFIGFTGTPVSITDRDTQAVFGPYIDVYDMKDSIRDGATVPIYYEARHIKVTGKDGEMLKLDKEIEQLTKDMDDEEKEKVHWSTIEKIAGLPERLEVLAKDLVHHFEDRTAIIDGKAMVVCMSRAIAIHLYEAIAKIRPAWHNTDPQKGQIKVVITGSAADPQEYQPHLYNDAVKKEIEKRFKNPNDPLKMVIVCDMWLTGFDVPCLHTMYLDKPIQGHNLIQAISRVNRVFKDKSGGLVVDYIGIARSLENAVRDYTQGGGRGDVAANIEQAYKEFLAYMDRCRDFLRGFDYSSFKTQAYALLPAAWDYIFKTHTDREKAQKDFADNCLSAIKAYGLCKPLPEASQYNEELSFFSLMRAAIRKKDGGKKADDPEVQSVINALVSSAITTDGVVDIFAQAGLDKPNLSIISEEFLKKIEGMEQKDLAAELLQRLIDGEIKSKFRLNIALKTRFSQKLRDIINKYNNGSIETSQVIEELIGLAKETNAAIRHGMELGLSDKEIAFYNALEENESSVRELGDEVLKKIAHELTDYLRKSTKIDWAMRSNVRAGIMLQIKYILRRYKYPPDMEAAAVERVLAQAEVISNDIAG